MSAPPRIGDELKSEAVTTTTTAQTTATEPDEAKTTITEATTVRETSTASDLWSVSAPPKITTRDNSFLDSNTQDKDKRNSLSEDYPPSSDAQIEWVFFEDFEGQVPPSEKSQPLTVLTFGAENITGAGTMDLYFDETADVSMLALSVSIIIGALCLGNAGSQSANSSGLLCCSRL